MIRFNKNSLITSENFYYFLSDNTMCSYFIAIFLVVLCYYGFIDIRLQYKYIYLVGLSRFVLNLKLSEPLDISEFDIFNFCINLQFTCNAKKKTSLSACLKNLQNKYIDFDNI